MEKSLTLTFGLLAAALLNTQAASALSLTQTGTFTNDSQVVEYDFTLASSTPITFFTTSYAGGMNTNGTTSMAGGFVPNLTLFQANGSVITSDGATGSARGGLQADPVTHLYDDSFTSTNLAAGSYILTLTEFPNVAVGDYSSGFLFSSPTATGDTCGVTGGKFLEADLAPCVQRTANYAFDVSTPGSNAPEPATLLLIAPMLAAAFLWRKRQSDVS